MSIEDTQRERLRRKVHSELGPALLGALEDPAVVEVMVNEDGRAWCDRLGKGLSRLDDVWSADRASALVGTVAAILGLVANADHPIVEGELPFDGSRFEGIVPPVARRAVFSVRKHASEVYSLDQYVEERRVTREQSEELRRAVDERKNILVAGSTASGKTTFVNALLREKVNRGDPAQRIVLLEDTAELQCAAANHVRLCTSDAADLQRLVRATLRLRPDSIVVGEVRGREALDVLKAWNTGHPGGLATVHANSAEAALSRMDQLIQEAGVPSQPALIAESIDLVVFLAARTVQQIVRVQGHGPAPGEFHLETLGDLR